MEAVMPRLSQRKQSEIEFFDCVTRFLVRSESRPNEVHLVDLDSDDRGRYECSCEDWHFRNPDWVISTIPYECKHIALAKSFIFSKALEIKRLEEKAKKLSDAPDFDDVV